MARTKSTSQLCSIKSPISEESDCASSSESSGSSESLDCSSQIDSTQSFKLSGNAKPAMNMW